MITPRLLVDDTHSSSKYFCRDCFRQLERAIKSVDFVTPLIVVIRKAVGMPHNIALAARDADMKDAGTQYDEESCSVPLGKSDSEESTSSSDTEQLQGT